MKAHRITPPIPAITLALIAAASPADFYSVDDDDPAADFDTIQAAVDVAVDGDTIFVGPGEYFDPGPLGRPVVQIVDKTIQLIAVSDDPSLTVISGDGVRRGVVWTGGGASGLLEGFTIDHGVTDGDGAGLLLEASPITVRECVFTNNAALGNGGAVHSTSTSPTPPVLLFCEFDSNSATNGGGTWASRGLDLILCDFNGNIADSEGGGSYFSQNPPGTGSYSFVTSCDYSNCRATFGGGIRGSVANLRVADSTFTSCRGRDFDGRVSGWGGGISMVEGSLQIADSEFDDCVGGRNGGAIDLDESGLDASGCDFEDCNAVNHGGAINGYGQSTTLAFDSCSFRGNEIYEGGGGAIGCAEFTSSSHATALRLDDCVFENNRTFEFGVCINAGNVVTAEDCIFGQQQAPNQYTGGASHLSLRGSGGGSRFVRCMFRDGSSNDEASSIRAEYIGDLEFIDCSFLDNRTNGDDTSAKGAVFIDASSNGDPIISFTGCDFFGNGICCYGNGFFAGAGGALRVVGTTVQITSCVMDGNFALNGGSIMGSAILRNCSIQGLASLGYGGAAHLSAGSEAIACRFSGSADCNYPLLYGVGPVAIDGCTFVGGDPENFFCNEDPADLAANGFAKGTTILDSRFCGYQPAAINGPWTDLGGNSFNPGACDLADLNGDGVVNGADLALVLADWGEPCLGCPSDINDDGLVNGADLALVLAAWGRG